MKNPARRVAAYAPSITGALILFAVGVTALLAYRAFDASRAQRRLIDHTLRDYASFTAFQLKNATNARIGGQFRQAFDGVVREVITHGPTLPLGARRVAALVEGRKLPCRGDCLDSVSFFFQITFADRRIEASPSPQATSATLRRLRDTVLTHATPPPVRREMAPAVGPTGTVGTPITTQYFVPIYSHIEGRPYVFAYVLSVDTTDAPIVAYGYAAPAERIVGRAVRATLASQPVLPTTLIPIGAADSIVAVRVTEASGDLAYATAAALEPRFTAADSLDSRQGRLRFEVSIVEAAAGRLIIGGLPRSRLPEVLATAFVALLLLSMLLYQFRRQEELGRLRDDFVAGVSHELRTPLAQIRLLAELLRMRKVPAEDQDRSLRIIDQEARRLSFLVDSILTFTPSQSRQLSPVPTDVAVEIEDIIGGFAPLAQNQSVHLTPRLESGLIAEVDRMALRQVLVNLLDNAVRYGPPGQTVYISTVSASNTWTLEVADEGPGIPKEERERIFAPYYRMKRDMGGAVGGTGIGLAVVRRLVTEHGGRVYVAAKDNNASGSRFVVSLPIAAPSLTVRDAKADAKLPLQRA